MALYVVLYYFNACTSLTSRVHVFIFTCNYYILRDRVIAMNGKFSEIGDLLAQNGVKKNSIDGALIDCGVSSIQFDTAERGFSISKEGPLDMRMGSDK